MMEIQLDDPDTLPPSFRSILAELREQALDACKALRNLPADA
jgi:hypothetical protein